MKKVEMTRRQKRMLVRILAAAVIFVLGLLLPAGWWQTGVLLTAYIFIGWDILWRAVRNILHGQLFDENFLMTVATVGALVLTEYAEGVAVMLFYQVGEWFQSYAVGRSRASIAALMDIRPDHANLLQPDGTHVQTDPEEVAVGAHILVKPGERVPLDGRVLHGRTTLDMAALTGESLPREAAEGDEVISGCINMSGLITVEVTKPYGESTVARILELVENSSVKKARSEQFITRFARWYTPAVCVAALVLVLIPPLVLGQAFGVWVYRALTFLVISCPCALVISIPLSFFGGIGGASKQGVLVKGGNDLETLAKVRQVVFDKTGTLTKGCFEVSEICAKTGDENALLYWAALAESYSDHPIAHSIQVAYKGKLDKTRVAAVEEVPGMGVAAQIEGSKVLVGNSRFVQAEGLVPDKVQQTGTVVHVAKDGIYQGWLLVQDTAKPDARQAIAQLRRMGVHHMVMLTGDADAVGQSVAQNLGLDAAYTQLLPHQKVEKLEQLLNAPGRKGGLVFVGDGINDAPVLARADVGVAMGGLGSDAAIEAADVVIMTDEPSKLAVAISVARKTMRIVRQNIVLALGIKGAVLVLGALGFANMWAAVFADVGVAVLAIINAMRAMQVQKMR